MNFIFIFLSFPHVLIGPELDPLCGTRHVSRGTFDVHGSSGFESLCQAVLRRSLEAPASKPVLLCMPNTCVKTPQKVDCLSIVCGHITRIAVASIVQMHPQVPRSSAVGSSLVEYHKKEFGSSLVDIL